MTVEEIIEQMWMQQCQECIQLGSEGAGGKPETWVKENVCLTGFVKAALTSSGLWRGLISFTDNGLPNDKLIVKDDTFDPLSISDVTTMGMTPDEYRTLCLTW